MLEEDRIAADCRIEDADVEQPFGGHQKNGDGHHRCSQNLDQAGRIDGPDKKRQPKPGEPRGPHPVDGDDEVQPRHDRGEADDKSSEGGQDHLAVGVHAAVGGVEGPTGVGPAAQQPPHHESGAQVVDVPARQVELWKGEVLGADHDRNQEVAQHRRNRRNQEEKDHDHAMSGKESVVDVRLHQVAGRCRQLEADEGGHETADGKEKRDGDQIEDGYPLVVLGQ